MPFNQYSGPAKWRIATSKVGAISLSSLSQGVCRNTDQTSQLVTPKPNQLLGAHTRTIVSQARPFQYDSESDRCCGTERVWLARLHARSQPQSNDVLQMESVCQCMSRDVYMFTPETPVADEKVVYCRCIHSAGE